MGDSTTSSNPTAGDGAQQPTVVPVVVNPELKVADLKNIQGDIILGLPKKAQKFFFFKIAKKDDFRKRLGDLVPLITSTAKAHADRQSIRNRFRKTDTLNMGNVNVAFSWSGLKLVCCPLICVSVIFAENVEIDNQRFKDETTGEPLFEAGMKAKRDTLRDDPDNWNPANWAVFDQKQETKGFEDDIHGVVMVVGEDQLRVSDEFAKVTSILGDTIEQAFVLDGQVRPGLEEGHEHFGFKDGISQPFIIGTESIRTNFPGQGAVKPGVILCGRDGDVKEPGKPGSEPQTRESWQQDGSFLAFRYLRQKVPEFDDFLARSATERVGKDLLGARMVGRWKSGAPLDIAPFQDDRSLAKDDTEVNNFHYEDNDADTTNPHSRCPFSAHIRKTNPRSDLPAQVMAAERVLRRGIPYGPEVDPSETTAKTSSHDRGLLFVCYQSHLANGFELMQKSWANNPKFIFAKDPLPGIDPIIGQSHKSDTEPEDTRTASGLFSANRTDPTNEPRFKLGDAKDEWVESRGGEYFFSPSISSIQRFIAM